MMDYHIKQLADLAGISTRTLRYYDEIGLLKPRGVNDKGYRLYGEAQVDRLQQMLLYRMLQIPLETIGQMLEAPEEDRVLALAEHLRLLKYQSSQLQEKMISQMKGEMTMSDQEKFERLKKQMMAENEALYGEELAETYDERILAASRGQFMHLSEVDYAEMVALDKNLRQQLEEAVTTNMSPHGEQAVAIALMHKRWLSFTWPIYTPQAHVGLAEMYVADERFKVYYDDNIAGCAAFLQTAIQEMVTQLER